MYHISDLKKFAKCPRLYFLDKESDEKELYHQYLRTDESYIELLKKKLKIDNCFTGNVGDSTDLFIKNADNYKWYINTRLEAGELRTKIPLMYKNGLNLDIYYLYYGTELRDLDFYTYRINNQILGDMGYIVDNIYITYINPDYVFHNKINPNKLFIVTNKFRNCSIINLVKDSSVDINKTIETINACSLKDAEPIKSRACHMKNTCKHYADCFKDEIDIEDDSILTLVSSQYKTKMFEEGIKLLKDVDLERIEGNRVQYAQIVASRNGGLFVDKYNLKKWLSKLDKKPISFIDFEWDRYLIPAYEAMKPLDVIPFEFALYIDKGDGKLEHKTFISKGDCRKEFVVELINSLPKEGTILAYNAQGAEILRIKELMRIFPEYEKELQDIVDRFKDLATPFVEGLVYDTRMAGNYSLKKLVDIISDKSYKDLDINEGMLAVYKWRNIDKGLDVEKDKIIDDLKKYCSLDAYGLYLVYKWLLNIVM